MLESAIEAAGGAQEYFANILPPGLLPDLVEDPSAKALPPAPHPTSAQGSATEAAVGTNSGSHSTPMNPSGEGGGGGGVTGGAAAVPNGGDTYQNLQTAQQVLQGLQQQQQQQHASSVSPGPPSAEQQ